VHRFWKVASKLAQGSKLNYWIPDPKGVRIFFKFCSKIIIFVLKNQQIFLLDNQQRIPSLLPKKLS